MNADVSWYQEQLHELALICGFAGIALGIVALVCGILVVWYLIDRLIADIKQNKQQKRERGE